MALCSRLDLLLTGLVSAVVITAFCMVLVIGNLVIEKNGPKSSEEDPSGLGTFLEESSNCGSSKTSGNESAPFKDFLSEASIIDRASDCKAYFTTSGPDFFNENEEENNFPLAFAIKVHKQIGILEMFLSVMFHPGDSFCIHVDAKASNEVKAAVEGLARCYRQRFPGSNVFTASFPIPVIWGDSGTITADTNCFRELEEKDKMWRMAVTVVGTELPLMTREEFRRRLKESYSKGNAIDVFQNTNPKRQKVNIRPVR